MCALAVALHRVLNWAQVRVDIQKQASIHVHKQSHSTASLHKTVMKKSNHKALYSSMQEPLPYRHEVCPDPPIQVDHCDEDDESTSELVSTVFIF